MTGSIEDDHIQAENDQAQAQNDSIEAGVNEHEINETLSSSSDFEVV